MARVRSDDELKAAWPEPPATERFSTSQDVMFDHFDGTGLRYWCDVAEEGRRIWRLMTETKDDGSEYIEDDIIGAVAAQSADGMCAAIAAALGVETRYLHSAISDWYEGDNLELPAVGADGLMALVAQEKALAKKN